MARADNPDFFDVLSRLIAQLREIGRSDAAAELESGFRCLNGLTDGWALLLESIQKVDANHWSQLTDEQRGTLDHLRVAVQSRVYRR